MIGKFQRLDMFRLPRGFRGRPAWVVQLWWLVQATAFAWSPQVMYSWRRWLLRRFGAQIGRGVLIRPSVTVTYPWKVSIGDHCWIGDDVVLYSLGDIHIGSNVCISQHSYLCAATHDHSKVTFDMEAGPITVEDEAWVAADVFVGPGVTVGRAAVIGARSSVFNDLPAEHICYGYPAQPVKRRGE